MADLLGLDCYAYCDFVTFLFGILCQVWYLIVLIPDLCRLSYFDFLTLPLKPVANLALNCITLQFQSAIASTTTKYVAQIVLLQAGLKSIQKHLTLL